MICAIHQPNFVPWRPYFSKIEASDVFVLLTECQFEKGGFQNRFRHDGTWFTMPVSKGLVPIREKFYLDPTTHWRQLKAKSKMAEKLSRFDSLIDESLLRTNSNIITEVLRLLGCTTEIVSDFPTSATRSERLIEICRFYEADTYLSGPSGRKYLDLDLFAKARIKVEYFSTTDNRSAIEFLP